MIARTVSFAIFAALLLCAFYATSHWNDDKHPLLVTTSGCAAGPNPCLRMKCEVKPDTRSLA